MLYLIAEQLGFPGLLNLIRYISFRAGGASATAMLIGLLMGPSFIRWLRAKQGKGQPIRADGPQSHLAKRGTPTMGGLLILIALGTSTLLWMDVYSPYVWACLLVTAGFGLIGFLDDYDKVKKAHHAGLSGKMRLFLEFAIAGFATWLMVRVGGSQLYLPFVQGPVLDLGWLYIPFGAFVIVSFGNSVNLTDGLDGLATMPVIIASVAFVLIAYLVGNVRYADYLGIPHVPGAGDFSMVYIPALGKIVATQAWGELYQIDPARGVVSLFPVEGNARFGSGLNNGLYGRLNYQDGMLFAIDWATSNVKVMRVQ